MQIKNTNNPLVSVIIPTYNRGWIVKNAIVSVLNQDFTDFELIVIDDGSTDNTAEVLQAIAGTFTVIRQDNQGVSAARNRGIRESGGRLIAFLDSDDAWLPQKLSAQVDFFSRQPHALICQTEEIWIRNGKRVNPGKRHSKLSGMIFEPSLHLCLVSPSAVMIRRRLFAEVGLFDETLPACEDYDLWLRISRQHPIYLIDKPLIVKNGGHDDQLSKTAALDKYRIQSITSLLESGTINAEQRKAALAVLKNKIAVYQEGCRKRGRLQEVKQYQTLADRFLHSES
jgi:glycosyltransferase involved in cell wall biosynthesis